MATNLSEATQKRPRWPPGPAVKTGQSGPRVSAARARLIDKELGQGLEAKRIWQDLVAEHGRDVFRYRTLVVLCKRIEVPQRSLFTDTRELIRPLSEYQRTIQSGDEE